jgi:tripartite-type tricarboxylate transporter receptor subunit TctC
MCSFRRIRSVLFPDLPTMDEAGIKGFNLDTWAGLLAPAGTPPQIVPKLNGALRKIIDSPEAQAQFERASKDFPRRPKSWVTSSRRNSRSGKSDQGGQHPTGLTFFAG